MERQNIWTEVTSRLSLPVVAAPLYIVSNPDLVIAQCISGVVGSFPALNARPAEELDMWLTRIEEALDAYNQAHPDQPAAPFAVNHIVHRSNDRFEHDLDVCARHKVPIMITSMGAREEVNIAAHSWGGITLHDVTTNTYARKAIAKGADGLIAVAAGAGGHAGLQSPFALVQEIRSWFDGPLLLSGSIATGRAIAAARILGADLAYIGSPFIATEEAHAVMDYKHMVIASGAEDIMLTAGLSGVPANYLRPSVESHGYNPEDLITACSEIASVTDGKGSDESAAKPWRDIWSAGQGIGAVQEIKPVADLIAQLRSEWQQAQEMLGQIAQDG